MTLLMPLVIALNNEKIVVDFGNFEYKTGEFIVANQTGIDSYYDVSFEHIENSSDIKISYCLTNEKLIEAQKYTEEVKCLNEKDCPKEPVIITPYKNYKVPSIITSSKTDSIFKAKVDTNIEVKPILDKLTSKESNCIELIENPYLVDEIKLGNNSTYIISQSDVFNSGNIFTNITSESSFSHLDVSGDTSITPWTGFNYTTRTAYPPYFQDDNNSYAVFDGVNDFINMTGVQSLNLTSVGTISTWFIRKSNTATYQFIYNFGSWNLDKNSYSLYINSANSLKGTLENSTAYLASPAYTVSNNIWYHVVFTWNGTGLVLYINGVQQGAPVVQTLNASPIFTFPPTIGGYSANVGSPTYYFNGSIDNLLILNTSLSATQVGILYRLGRRDATYTNASLVSAWRFDNTNIPNAEDSTGKNNGTFNGTTYGLDPLGLVAYYPFDINTATTSDYSKNNNDGTLSGVTFNSTDCPYGNCYSFDGVNDLINTGKDLVGIDIFTFCAWIYPRSWNGTGTTSPRIFGNVYTSLNIAGEAYPAYQNHSLMFSSDGFSARSTSGENSITLNTWQHVCVVRNETVRIKFYVNGIESVGTWSNYGGSPIYGITNVAIGNEISISRPFNGSIDEVMFFNTKLNDSQILDIYNNQSQRFKSKGIQTIKQINITSGYNQLNLSTTFNNFFASNISARLGAWDVSLGYNNTDLISPSGLVAYYNFDESSWNGTSGEVKDTTGLNNGTAIAGANTSSNGIYYRKGSFDGVDDKINLNSDLIGTGADSICAWIYPVGWGGNGAGRIIDNGKFIIFVNNAGTNVNMLKTISDGASGLAETTSNSIVLNRWQHFCSIRNSTGWVWMYINGVLNVNQPSGTPAGNSTAFVIGNRAGNDRGFNGSIDEVIIFNRSLSSDEVKEIYVKGRAKWNYTDYQNLTGGNVFNISSSSTNILPDFNLFAGNQSNNPFYTPNLMDGMTLDTIPPTYVIISPLNGSNINNQSVNFTINLTDNDGLKNATIHVFNLSGVEINTTSLTFIEQVSASVNVIINLIDKFYTWCVEFWDRNGNQVISPNQTILIDTIFPTINITYPINNSYYTTQIININATTNDTNKGSLVPDLGLVNWWRMDDVSGTTIIDYMNKNNGTNSGAIQTTAGRLGKGFVFTNANDKINISNDSIGTGADSICAWIYPRTWGDGNLGIILTNGKTIFKIVSFDGSTWMGISFSSDGVTTTSNSFTQAITLNTWNHACVTRNASGATNLYVNTILSGSANQSSGTPTAGTFNLTIGNNYTSAQAFNGTIDDLMIFNRTLTSTEIISLYNSTVYSYINNYSSDGIKTVKMYSQDLAGNINTTSNTFYIDTTPPNVKWLNQTPADVTSLNIIGARLNITYNINDSLSGVNTSTVQFKYKTNNTLNDCSYYTNGTASCGYQTGSLSQSNNSYNWLFQLGDNRVYPATYNFDAQALEDEVHTRQTLTSAADYIAMQFLNVSNATTYGFFEIMSNSTSIQRIYYCNSSFTSNTNPATANYCTLFSTIPANQPFNHFHPLYSYHQVSAFALNTSTGIIGTVKITPTSWFVLRGNNNPANTIGYYSINNLSRTGAMRTTTNNGNTWTNQTYTVDAHLHQYYGNDTLYYYVCANDTLNNQNCSTGDIKSDLLDHGGIPPTSPYVYSPTNETYAGNISINYTASVSPNGYPILGYNISLLNLDYSFNKTIIGNNSLNLSYVWDTKTIDDGNYVILVKTYDSINQTSVGYSEIFIINNSLYFYNGTPVNQTIVYHNPLNYNINAMAGVGFDCFAVNDSRFKINCNGLLENNTILGVGTYYLNITINSTSKINSTIMWVNITKAVSSASLNFDKTSPQYYGVNLTPTCVMTNGETPAILKMDGMIINSSDVLTDLNASIHFFNCTVPETQNYTYSQYTYNFEIAKAIPPLILSSSSGWLISAPSYSTITGSGCPAILTCNLYEFNLNISNPYTASFPVGSYYFNYNVSGNDNYTSLSISNTLISTISIKGCSMFPRVLFGINKLNNVRYVMKC